MRKHYFAGIACLLVALVLFLSNIVEISFIANSSTVAIYPAAFFGLLGLLLIFRGAREALE